MERILQDLNNLKTKEGLTLQWKEKATTDGQWQVTGDLRSPRKGQKLQETNVASTKIAGRKMCAAVLLARYKTPILAQSYPLGTETADTTRTTDNEPPADDLEQQVKMEDRICMSLLGYGRQPVSARELQRRISSEGFEFGSKSKSATDYGNEAESVRYTGMAKLLAENAASPVQGASRPCIEPIPAKIQAHHNLLRSMSVSSVFTADFQDRCKKI